MSVLHKSKNRKSGRGQGLVEFALAFPIFLLIVLGIFEFGRLFVIYTSVYAAAREGARYGAAVDNLCNANIEAEAERAGFLAGDLTIETKYKIFNRQLQILSNNCADAKAGDVVLVKASTQFNFITGFIPVPGGGPIELSSTAQRSIIKKVYIKWTLAPVPTGTSVAGWNPDPSAPTDLPTATQAPNPTATATQPTPKCEGAISATTDPSSPYTLTLSNLTGQVYKLDSITINWGNSPQSKLIRVEMGGNWWEGSIKKSPATISGSDLDGWYVIPGENSVTIVFSGLSAADFQGISVNMTPATGGTQCTLP